jgi:hypothetical protein
MTHIHGGISLRTLFSPRKQYRLLMKTATGVSKDLMASGISLDIYDPLYEVILA